MRKPEDILKEMTLEEKAGLCSGTDFWHTKAVERLELPAVMMSDGPHGLRKQSAGSDNLGLGGSVEAVCFPSGAGLAASFDRELMGELGAILAEEARAELLHTVLGPAVNIKRSPLCGRSFEYLSEDPYLAGELSAAYVQGMQAGGVGVSVKHYAANNQEYHRMSVDAKVDERTLREIYLAAFETAVKKAKPWSLMCSYNRINGVYSCENPWLLDKVLREEWGFDGIVMTDWGAMNRRDKALAAGLELEMPSSHGENDKVLVEAVQNGTLSEEALDKAVLRLLRWIEKSPPRDAPAYNKEEHHERSRRIAARCAVLLKNDGALPLRKKAKLAFIGGFAEKPRFQGGGSSHINSFKTTCALDAVKGRADVVYAKGFDTGGDQPDDTLLREAVAAAESAEIAVIFAGLPDSFESEGYDRSHLRLPDCQNRLIEMVAAAQPSTVVVLHNGSPVVMPWLDKVDAVLELYLGGQAVGQATVDLLFGDANPGGKLAETFPQRLEDTPCYLDFPGNGEEVVYSEGVYVGYRWYDARDIRPLFPFGFGLSYTTFALSEPSASATHIRDADGLTVTVKVRNTGGCKGREVVQLYIAPGGARKQPRPPRELKGFASVELLPGEEKSVTFALDFRSFAYYETRIADWFVEGGDYDILLGTSSVDLPHVLTVAVEATKRIPLVVDDTTTLGEAMDACVDKGPFLEVIRRTGFLANADGEALGDRSGEMLKAMLYGMPLHSLCSFGGVSREEIVRLEELARNGV